MWWFIDTKHILTCLKYWGFFAVVTHSDPDSIFRLVVLLEMVLAVFLFERIFSGLCSFLLLRRTSMLAIAMKLMSSSFFVPLFLFPTGCQIILAKDLEGLEVTLPKATRNFYVDGHVPQPHWHIWILLPICVNRTCITVFIIFSSCHWFLFSESINNGSRQWDVSEMTCCCTLYIHTDTIWL